ncbi:hypothetical protein ALON55S_04403 [Alishewanella longhuensis]
MDMSVLIALPVMIPLIFSAAEIPTTGTTVT